MRRHLVWVVLVVTGACAGGGGPSSADVRAAAENFSGIVAEVDAAWNSGSLDAMRAVFTEDVIHHDDSSLNHFEGIDAILAMASTLFPRLDGNQTTSPVFVGEEAGVGVSGTDGVLGVTRATDEGPLEEVDVFETRDGRVAYWRPFFADERFSEGGSLSAAYAAAWSSGDAEAVGLLYSPGAVREDGLFGDRAEGRQAVVRSAGEFFDRHPAASWELMVGYGDVGIYTDPAARGGIFGVTAPGPGDQPCRVEVAVVFETDDQGILQESIYYEPDSLVACGWVD